MFVDIFHKSDFLLAESPFWSQEYLSLFWVDILENKLFRKTLNGDFFQYSLPEALTCFYVKGTIVYGCTESGFVQFDLEKKNFIRLVSIEEDINTNRSNDGKLDGGKSFIFGTMSRTGDEKTGKIYLVDTESLTVKQLDDGYFIPNGFAFNLDYTELVVADSYVGLIYKYDYDKKNGVIKNKRVFHDMSDTGFSPDGMAVSNENNIWNAIWDGAMINKYGEDGSIIGRIDLPVIRPTSCVFGGKDEDILYVTSATEGLNGDQLMTYPHSGSILSINLNQ